MNQVIVITLSSMKTLDLDMNMQLLKQFALNKRDAKELLKLQIELFENYFQENSTWSKHTVRSYLHMITDSMTYSSIIEPSKFKNFIYSESKIKDSVLNQNIELIGTSLSYAKWICKFLSRIMKILHKCYLHI